jgi:nucleotide-binding universal stress UspA family protein
MAVGPMPPVVVGLDGSAAGFAALELAADEAAGRVTPLEVVLVHRAAAGSTVESAAALTRSGELLAAALGRVAADHPGLAVRGVFLLGDPADALVRQAEDACLVVVGYRGCGGSGSVGPVAAEVASRAPAPVIVCRPFDREHAGGAPRAMVLGVDGLPCSERAVTFAFEEAALRGAPVEVHHVWSPPPGAGIACCFPEAFYAEGADAGHARNEAHRMLRESIAVRRATYPDVEVREVTDPGTVEGLLAASHDAQLVVIGTHSHAGLSSTVSQALVERAGCSVAVTQSV